ncbi:polyprenyl synthetase family protein [Streptomyces melanogenes]|uniref:polyprenyl synthetase family protein n=1 Tax=Streptomyces melanogenes TaxID=67326 RepID=UPI00167EE56F|nr:polyprenyl synthetase family protein [Streptomyces melanogenes]GGP91299.1 hypothetical protein GCM10010278_81940 [Streptomyces melanogenes]
MTAPGIAPGSGADDPGRVPSAVAHGLIACDADAPGPGAEAPGAPPSRPPAHDVGAAIAVRLRRAAQRVDEHVAQLYPAGPAADAAEWLLPGTLHDHLAPGARAHLARRLHQALAAPVRHLVEAGGQRWRPGLVATVIDLLGGDSARYGPLLAAMEIAHTGSLMVDDIQDSSAVRRGVPAAHETFGIPTALNAGTNAYFALDRAIRMTVTHDAALSGRLREVYFAALRAAHAGQALDIQGHRAEMDHAVSTGDPGHVLDLVRLTHRLKSGALLAAGFEMAALLTGADDRRRCALAAFGSVVGTTYQITDDVADLRGVTRAGVVTKRVAEDARNGKVTMPLAHAVARLPQPQLKEVWQLVRGQAAREGDLTAVRRTLIGCGAAAACEQEADALLEEAWQDLEPELPHSPGTPVLYEMARHTVRRNRIA